MTMKNVHGQMVVLMVTLRVQPLFKIFGNLKTTFPNSPLHPFLPVGGGGRGGEGEGGGGEGNFGKECVEFISCSAAQRGREELQSWPSMKWKLGFERDEGALTPLSTLSGVVFSSLGGQRKWRRWRRSGEGWAMAEPLLKRTFSRLRGRDRSRRKTDPKLSGEQLQHQLANHPIPTVSWRYSTASSEHTHLW